MLALQIKSRVRNNTERKILSQKRRTLTKEKRKKAGQKKEKDAGKQSKVKKIKVLIVGDSQLRRIDDLELSNNHRDIQDNCKPGIKSKQAIRK